MATRSEFIEIVKSKINELTPFDGGLALISASGNIANNPVETYIDQFLDESATEVLLEAPSHLLPLTAFTTVVYTLADKKAVITIPSTYLRVGIIKFSSWERPVYRAVYPGDRDYYKQFNRWTRGGKAKPAATFINESGKNKLVCYGVESVSGNDLRYVAITVAEDLDARLEESLSWNCASLVLQVYEKDKPAEVAYGRYKKSLSLL